MSTLSTYCTLLNELTAALTVDLPRDLGDALMERLGLPQARALEMGDGTYWTHVDGLGATASSMRVANVVVLAAQAELSPGDLTDLVRAWATTLLATGMVTLHAPQELRANLLPSLLR